MTATVWNAPEAAFRFGHSDVSFREKLPSGRDRRNFSSRPIITFANGTEKLKFDSLNKWLTLTANTGVLIGVALILIELNQNSRLAEAEFNLSIGEQLLGNEFAMMEGGLAEIWATSISDPQSLTASEIRALDSFYATLLVNWYSLYDLEQRGLIDEGTTASNLYSARFFFGNSFAIAWWQTQHESWRPDFVEVVDEAISKVDASANEDWIRDLQSKFEEPQ